MIKNFHWASREKSNNKGPFGSGLSSGILQKSTGIEHPVDWEKTVCSMPKINPLGSAGMSIFQRISVWAFSSNIFFQPKNSKKRGNQKKIRVFSRFDGFEKTSSRKFHWRKNSNGSKLSIRIFSPVEFFGIEPNGPLFFIMLFENFKKKLKNANINIVHELWEWPKGQLTML